MLIPKRIRKKSKNPYPKLVHKLTELMSITVRKSFANESGYVACVCCGKVYHWKSLDAGHFIPKARGVAVRFDWFNVWPQCKPCNKPTWDGERGKIWFYDWMLDTFGRDEIERLQNASASSRKQSRSDLEDQIRLYEECVESLAWIE